jgi:hypothetical protein
MRKITTILLLCLSATLVQAQISIGGNIYGGGNAGDTKGNTNVTVYAGDLNRVFGGAQKANVGGHSFVYIDGEHASDYVLINYVYGGNDVSGVIGNNSELEKSVPTEIKKATENLVDKSWNGFVRISTKMNGAVAADDNQKIYIGQLFGGGNGAYDYTSEKLIDGVTPNPYYGLTKPELAKSYLEVMGGSIVYAFGGGNNATVTEKTVIYVDNPSKVVNEILVDGVDQITKDNRVVDKMNLNPGYTYPSSDAYQIGSFFGGNNTAEMKIRPRWNLKSGKIRNVYSGGNKGDMTSPDGLLLQIPEESKIIVDNVYGGCRMADIIPKDKDGNPVTAAAITEDDFGNELHIPAGMAARARVLGGHVNNVYGGNDITGHISGGSTVGIYTTIYGDVYGGGNGSYPYTDNAKLKDDPTYGDLYYTVPLGKTSVEALNDYRPNAEQVSIYVQGTEAKKTIIHGSVYCGGNSASLSSSMDNPKVELKVGSYAIVDNLFFGNNGEHMVETHEKDAEHPQEGVLRTMKSTSITSDGSQFNSIDLTNSETFATYMEGVTMPLIPSIVFAKESSGDPATYIPYTSYFGSVYSGGNVGSMKIDGKKTTLNFTENVIIYNKLVGGCNNANVASTAYNAAYDGGFIGTPDTNGDKLQLNLSGLRMQPKRWKKNIGDYYTPELAEGESYDTYPGYTDYVIDANGNHLLEWNTISSITGKEVRPVLSGTGISSDEDKARRFIGGNVYGGCYNSGHINGNVIINMNSTVVDRKGQYAVFDQVLEDEGEAKLYENENYHITTRVSGVILDEQGMDVLGSALNVFGGGYGKDSEIWGNVTVNLNAGYTFQIFGGGEQGVIGKPNDGTGDDYTFNSKTFKYNPKYSCTINIKGDYPGVARNAPGDNDNMAAAEFIYGGGFKGPVCGNTVINLGNGRVFNTFAGACDADILGHTATYMGRNTNDDTDLGFPYVRDHVYGGNDLGGRIMGSADFSGRLSTDLPITPYKPQETSAVTTASAYMEYVQGHVDYIFGGCYGDYDYTTEYAGYTSPRMNNAFVNFKPNQHISNEVNKIFGAGQGAAGFNTTDKNLMQNRSYVLMDLANTGTKFADLEVFGAGQNCGVGMGIAKATADGNADGVTAAAVVDLARGQIGAAYGGSLNEGVTRRTIVNVPTGSTIKIGSIFAGAYGSDIYQPCDVYEGTVNYHSADAYLIYNKDNTMMKGALYGGNNLKRRTIYGKINIDVPVRQSHPDYGMTTATVYGAGCGSNTWSEYTEVNLNNGAQVWEVYGGGEAGGVMSAESVQKYVTAFKPAKDEQGDDMTDDKWHAAWTLGGGYDPTTIDWTTDPVTYEYAANTSTNLQNPIAREAEIDDRKDTPGTLRFKRYNTNVIINEGAYVGNYAYGGGLGKADDVFISSGDVYGTTYIALLGGKVNKDLYAAGTMGTVYNLFGADFIASANAYIQGGTARNVYGGGWAGAVGYHTGDISAATTTDIPGETHVVIGKKDGTSFVDGIPAIERNAYGGGEGGPVFGTANITLNKGYIGYRYFVNKESADPGAELIGITDGGGYYQEKLHDETWPGDGTNRLYDSGCIFGGGYIDNSSVDVTNVKMYGGVVRNALFGGGEIAAVGRGVIEATGVDNSVRTLKGIYKAGKANVTLYEGDVHRNVFGGGRGYNNLGEGGTLYSDGYVFGQTEVHVHGGTIGTAKELERENGNVFGGGDIGYVYSAYEENGKLFVGIKDGKRYDNKYEGYYYAYDLEKGLSPENYISYIPADYVYDENDLKWVMDNGEYVLTEDCKVLIEPYCKAKEAVTVHNHDYAAGEYVTTEDLHTLGNKEDNTWGSLDVSGITIFNAVFAGGNTSSGSSTVYANATTVFGNATASIHDVYHRDLITLGTGRTGGLYGDGNFTFVDGYRGLNITNYGTDYYSLDPEIDYKTYEQLPSREADYYQVKYKCKTQCTDNEGTIYYPEGGDHTKASTLTIDDLLTLFDGNTTILLTNSTTGEKYPNPDYWEQNGVVPVYAGRPMNTLQRADFCGIFGSRMVMQGAEDRVPEIVDHTKYTINRVREVSLNQKRSVRTGDASDPNMAVHGNYFGIYSIVNYLGALTSDVFFLPDNPVRNDIRVTDNESNPDYKTASKAYNNGGTEVASKAYGTATFYDWKAGFVKDRKRNNGTSKNKVALASGVYLELTTEQSTGDDLYEKDWGYITGVIELDLINVQPGMGGGFVYAKNVHKVGTYSPSKHNTLTELNDDAVTRRDFTFNGAEVEWETSGNFIHSTQTIIDDCYNISGKYSGEVKPGGAVPAHYWFIKGSVYVYDQYISAYTGAPNAYSETVDIPLTITAASHGTMKLLNVMPNKYAYYSTPGMPMGVDKKIVINDVEYHLNDPINYWDWFLLTSSEKALFVDETYVTTADCKYSSESADIIPAGTVMLPSEYATLKADHPKVYHIEKQQMVDFDFVYRSSNNMSHDTGYMLTYRVNNPTDWDTWYTKAVSSTADKKQKDDEMAGYEDGPTYHLKNNSTGGVLGQREYKVSNLIAKEIYDTYQTMKSNHTEAVAALGEQAEFEGAYIVTSEYTSGDVHLNVGSSVSATQAASMTGYVKPAYICTGTIQLSKTEYIYVGNRMTAAEKEAYKTAYPSLASIIESDIVPAYYCTNDGLYGGNYYEANKNYRGLEVWSSMSKADREQFEFNYDAFDVLIDPNYSKSPIYEEGKKYQYDSAAGTKLAAEANPAGYSLEKPVDYRATYNGSETSEHNGITLEKNKEYSRTEYESLPNEKRHYTTIDVKEAGNVYVVNTPFQVGSTLYAVGTVISENTYNSLGDSDRAFVTTLTFTNEQKGQKYYYCRESYKVGENTEGVAVTSAGITGGGSGSYGDGQTVPVGLVIDVTNYNNLPNRQKDFTIHGIAPTETSTLYVSRFSDIFDLSKEKIITVIYEYNYEETDATGANVTPVTERHVVNIHVLFKSGIPTVEDIKAPQIVLPGTFVGVREPHVTPGAYEVTGGGWKLFEKKSDAESHINGIEYTPTADPLYWYQHGYYLAYYAKTYLGETYSNTVQVSVANYHDLKKVLDDTSHHYYVDNPTVKRNSKIYINDATDGATQLKQFYDLSKSTLDEHVRDCQNLEFILHTNVTHTGDWTPIGDEGHCFSGNFHGDGYRIDGLDNSLFGHLCGNVYNLGVTGSFTSAGIADTGDGFVENCWINTTGTPASGVKAVFGNPYPTASGYKRVNCYYPNTLAYNTTSDGHGLARPMPADAFYNGTVAYDLNGFYLFKRYNDHITHSGSPTEYTYYAIKKEDGTLTEPQTKHYEKNAEYCSSGYDGVYPKGGYVEERYGDGDFRYADGVIPESEDQRTLVDADGVSHFYPIWPDDYIYFGQTLTYGYDASRAHQDIPSHINQSGNRLQTDATSNRVYRAPAYFQSKEMDMAHFNPNAFFAQTKNGDASVVAYKNMTAIDFTGGNGDVSGGYKKGLNNKVFYAPLLDDDGLIGFRNIDLTQNLLVYTGTVSPASAATDAVVSGYLPDVAYSETDATYRTVAIASTNGVKGHQIVLDGSAYTATKDHLLVDKQDFNCPISYTFADGKRMWYQRMPDLYVDLTKGWEAVSLPFTAELVTTQQKGEITHFYSGSRTIDGNGTKIGHEYWLREYKGINTASSGLPAGVISATFNYPDAAGDTKTVGNTFLWDYYYSWNGRLDANTDTYQTYYQTIRTLEQYPLLATAKPYIIGFPGKTYYEFDLSGEWTAKNTAATAPAQLSKQAISFVSVPNITIAVSDDELNAVSANSYNFMPNYMNKKVEGYLMNATGSSFDKTPDGGLATVPFRPYFVAAPAQNGAPRRVAAESIVFDRTDSSFAIGDDPSDELAGELTFSTKPRKLITTSSLRQPADVRIYNVSGVAISTFTIQPGETISTNISIAGVYIVRADGGRIQKKFAIR